MNLRFGLTVALPCLAITVGWAAGCGSQSTPIGGRAVVTDQYGEYWLNGVTGVAQVRAAKDGYVTATQNVSGDTEHVIDIEIEQA